MVQDLFILDTLLDLLCDCDVRCDEKEGRVDGE